MGKWRVEFSSQAFKDAKKIGGSSLQKRVDELVRILKEDPFQNPPAFEKLVGDLSGFYSRRINLQHRLVYEIIKKEKLVKVLRMWTHYE